MSFFVLKQFIESNFSLEEVHFEIKYYNKYDFS